MACVFIHLGPGRERIGMSGSGWVSGLLLRAPRGEEAGMCGHYGWVGPLSEKGPSVGLAQVPVILGGLGKFKGHCLGS